MIARVRRITDGFVAALRTVDGYADDGVVVGVPTPADFSAVRIWLSPGGVQNKRGDGADLGAYKRTMELDVIAVAAAADDTASEKVLAAADLADAIVTVIEATLDTLVAEEQLFEDVEVSLDTLAGDELGVAGAVGVCQGTISVWWISDQGGGQ